MNRFRERLKSDSGEANTISVVLIIALVVILIAAVWPIISSAVMDSAQKTSECIKDAGSIVNGGSPNCGK